MTLSIKHLFVLLWTSLAVIPSFVQSQSDVADMSYTPVSYSGELKKWHGIKLTFNGPHVAESDTENPFLNYRLQVTFTHEKSGQQFNIPGFYAADGNAAQTSATSGNKWRVIFTPNASGEWRWQASFRKGSYVAVSERRIAGVSGGYMDKQKGKFTVKKNDKTFPDFRQRGRLDYVNEPYLRFQESGGYFIKAGPDSPENLLAYSDFDGTYHDDGKKDELIKTWSAHKQDWQQGDPIWQKNKGKGLVGALNYISSKGMNSISFLTLNIKGDDENVFPYIDDEDYARFDVSKLEQWDIVFAHAQAKGLFLHFKTQEVENQGLLDNGGIGLYRQLYYRELIARFGYHLALNWNMGEENGDWYPSNKTPPQNTTQRLAMAEYFYKHDPYRHHVVIHNGIKPTDLTGDQNRYTGVSLQTHREDFGAVHAEVKKLRELPSSNGRPWAISVDEPGDAEYALASDKLDSSHDNARMNGLWGAYMAGAWGTEWYFGYKNEHSDLTAQDWRTRDKFWEQAKYALAFFEQIDVPFNQSVNMDQYGENAWVLGLDGDFYIAYAKDASKPIALKLPTGHARYRIQWYNPRHGGKLQEGSVKNVTVSEPVKNYWRRSVQQLGKPLSEQSKDWVILVTVD